ncbi:MAG: hypothetical protein Q8N23_17900 [Archangium sp.]|nr:hypothetical protein [Archangium sp.]MDP3569404.1 hypothetical protein [Archangium sp.]
MSSKEQATFRVHRTFAILMGVVGGLIFLPTAVSWPLDLLRGGSVTDGADVLVIVTGVGWAGLALIARFITRPRLELSDSELRENRLFLSTAIPLSDLTSIERVSGRLNTGKPSRVDALYLFRAHPEKRWVVDLGFVDAPEKFMAALLGRVRLKCANYTPRDAPPWTRG